MIFDRVIWDFNGTILDDVETCIQTANQLLTEFSLPIIPSREKYLEAFRFPIIDYYRQIGFDFTKYEYKVPADRWVEIYLSKEKDIPLRDGIIEAVTKLNEMGVKQTVLSATEKQMLLIQIKNRRIENLFGEIYGRDDVYAESKIGLARAWAESHKGEHPVFVGDTVHDLESAVAIGCPCILLSGGHGSPESLKKSGCVIASTPLDIPEIVKNGIKE